MKEELNSISKEDFVGENINSDLPEYKRMDGDSSDSSKRLIKDNVGVWTERQIAEDPIGYLNYLRHLLKNNELKPDMLSKISAEIKRVESTYLSNDYAIGGRSR